MYIKGKIFFALTDIFRVYLVCCMLVRCNWYCLRMEILTMGMFAKFKMMEYVYLWLFK